MLITNGLFIEISLLRLLFEHDGARKYLDFGKIHLTGKSKNPSPYTHMHRNTHKYWHTPIGYYPGLFTPSQHSTMSFRSLTIWNLMRTTSKIQCGESWTSRQRPRSRCWVEKWAWRARWSSGRIRMPTRAQDQGEEVTEEVIWWRRCLRKNQPVISSLVTVTNVTFPNVKSLKSSQRPTLPKMVHISTSQVKPRIRLNLRTKVKLSPRWAGIQPFEPAWLWEIEKGLRAVYIQLKMRSSLADYPASRSSNMQGRQELVQIEIQKTTSANVTTKTMSVTKLPDNQTTPRKQTRLIERKQVVFCHRCSAGQSPWTATCLNSMSSAVLDRAPGQRMWTKRTQNPS